MLKWNSERDNTIVLEATADSKIALAESTY